MKIKCIDENNFIAFLIKDYYSFDKLTLEKCLYKVLKRIKKTYSIDICFTFNVDCYISNYGIILIIKKDNSMFSKYINKTNFNIKFYDKLPFLFEIEDYFVKDKIKSKLYVYNSKYYIDVLDNNYMSITEYIKDIIYGDDVIKIINSNGV